LTGLEIGSRFSTAAGRWAAVGPYYAMFPTAFADKIVREFTRPGDGVLDPFTGRATSIYSSATKGRVGLGMEINPVGWLYGKVKLAPAPRESVESRFRELLGSRQKPDDHGLPGFFEQCFTESVLRFLLIARLELNWIGNAVDRTLMAFLLIYLHGKLGEALSNQMRQSKAMSPEYSMRWWQVHSTAPPEVNLTQFFEKRIEWRYRHGIPDTCPSDVLLGDSCHLVSSDDSWRLQPSGGFKLLFTSPPYCGVTNYHYDQWLRLWLLGGPDLPGSWEDYNRGKFESRELYRKLLTDVFSSCADRMDRAGHVYVRTDAREVTFTITHDVLQQCFRGWSVKRIERPFGRPTQTALFGDKKAKPGEIDLILSGPRV
jgi:hypothetical protein